MIEVKDFEERYDLYDEHGNFIDRITDYLQWLDVRCQIKEQDKVAHYLMTKDGVKIEINRDGNYDWETHEPYSIVVDMLMKLL
jgi:hypothetical protein